MPPKAKPEIIRFLSKIVISEDTWNGSHCWLWNAALNEKGYGVFWSNKKTTKAHRWFFEYSTRCEIPKTNDEGEEIVIDHQCRVRNCVNPAHLRAITATENILADGALSPCATNSRKTECIRGHQFDEQNTVIRQGKRQCKICNKERDKKVKAKR